MKKLILALATILAACGNDPITNAGYFDDDVDKSTTTTTNYTNDESNTSNSNNTTTNNYYHDSVIVVHDTLTRTITTRVTDTMYVKDTLTFTDTLTVHTSSTDTIVKNIKEVVRDTLRDTLTVTVRDTVRELRVDTIKEVITKTDTVRLLKRDTVKMMSTDYFDSLQTLYDNLLSYNKKAVVGDNYTISYEYPSAGGRIRYMQVKTDRTFATPTGGSYAVCLDYIDAAVWMPKSHGSYVGQNDQVGYGSPEHHVPTDLTIDGKQSTCGAVAPYGYCVLVTRVYVNIYEYSKKLYESNTLWEGVIKVC